MKRVFILLLIASLTAPLYAQLQPINVEKDNSELLIPFRSLALECKGQDEAYQKSVVAAGLAYLNSRLAVTHNKFVVASRYRNLEQMRLMADEAAKLFAQQEKLMRSCSGYLYKNNTTMFAGKLNCNVAPSFLFAYEDAIEAVRNNTPIKPMEILALSDCKYPTRTKGKLHKISWNLATSYTDYEGESLYNYVKKIFPRATLQDIYKSAFQDQFGPAHIVSDSASAAAYITKELERVPDNCTTPIFDITGVHSNYIRVNLSLVKGGIISVGELTNALMRSAVAPKESDLSQWACRWSMLLEEMPRTAKYLDNYRQDSTDISNMLSKGQYVIHHSQQFNQAYDYHYRLIRSDIFFKELWPRIVEKYKEEESK